MRAFGLATAVGLLCYSSLAVAQTVAPTNSTSWVPDGDDNRLLVLEINHGIDHFYVQPLNNASFEAISVVAPQANGVGGNLYVGQQAVQNNWTKEDVALIQCDPYPGEFTVQQVTDEAIKSNVSAIIFYSLMSSYCNATDINFSSVYSTTNVQNATYLSSEMNRKMIQGMPGAIFTEKAFEEALAQEEGSSNPSTAVAMIILYSITGVITALFLLIIVTGAVRAHRHPERYGPRNILGGTRQSRARGIARAMLDTIPIVKFGDSPADGVNKDPDVEMNATSSQAHADLNSMTAQHGGDAGQASSAEKLNFASSGTDTESGEGGSRRATSSNEDASAQAGSSTETIQADGTATGADNSEEGLGCSICTDDFERGQDIRVLPCNHKFHPACVDPWLLDVSGTCPLCRIDLRPEGNRTSENENDLPPPLDANHNEARRMSTLRTLFMFNRGSLSNASPEERIAALRRFRELNRRNRRAGPADAIVENPTAETTTTTTTSEENGNRLSRLFRQRRSVAEGSVTANTEQASQENVESSHGNNNTSQQ